MVFILRSSRRFSFFSSIIPFLSIIGLKLKRTVTESNIEVGEVLTIDVIVEKPVYTPFFYYHLSDTTPETFVSERNHQLFSFSFDKQLMLSYEAKALQRGVYQFNETIVHANDLFGLISVKRTLHSDTEIVISPAFYPITNKKKRYLHMRIKPTISIKACTMMSSQVFVRIFREIV